MSKNAKPSVTFPKPKKQKRPPSKVWITFDSTTGKLSGTPHTKKGEALDETFRTGLALAGPYVLAERVRQK